MEKQRRYWHSTVFILNYVLILTNLLQCVQLEQEISSPIAEGAQCLGGWDEWSECGGCIRSSQRSCKDNDDLIETRQCVIGKYDQ